jgi:hypothetical protein
MKARTSRAIRASDADSRKRQPRNYIESSRAHFATGSSTTLSIQRKASCVCGGGCPACQSKNNLNISQPTDAAEIEADAVADRVLRMPAVADAPAMSRTNSEETRQLKPLSTVGGVSSHNPDHVNRVVSSGGQPLDSATRGFFEPRLGHDLSTVRVHTDSAASRSAIAVDARAYTLGRNIVFGSGEYDPGSESGKNSDCS